MKKQAPNANHLASVANLLRTVEVQAKTIRDLTARLRELEAGEGWNALAPIPFADSVTNDTSLNRLPE